MSESEDSKDMVFASIDLKKYEGMWVAICETEIIHYGKNAKETFEEAKRREPHKKIIIARVPEEQTMIY